MKNVDFNELEKILTIIKTNPSTTITVFSDKDKELLKLLYSFSKNKQIDFIANITNKEFYEKLQELLYTRYFSLQRANYMLNGKFYDYVFVDISLNENFQEEFLKRVHGVIKNAGLILIFAKKGDYSNIDRWYRLLEENYYVATSTIDIDSLNTLIISRKMHGWGG